MKNILLTLLLVLCAACSVSTCADCAAGTCTVHSAPSAAAPPSGHVAAQLVLKEAPTCANCTGAITGALKSLPGVSAVEVSVGDTALRVWHDPSVTDAALLAALDEAGRPAAAKP